MTLTTLPDHLKPAVKKARRAVDQVDHRSATSMDDLVAKITDAAILAFLNACLEEGVAQKANSYADGDVWTTSNELRPDAQHALILNVGGPT